MTVPTVRLSVDASYDWLMCASLGFVDDGLADGSWRVVVDDRVAVASHPETGEPSAFALVEWETFDPAEHEAVFTDPQRFAVPQLGLLDASIGEVCLAARAWLGPEPTLDRAYFHLAMAAPAPEDAVEQWKLCLEAGDMQAHYALGYTTYELGDFARSYRHLRAYTELAPWNGWGWCWRGKAAAALGETVEARRAFERALRVEERGGDETDAAELLADLQGLEPSSPAS